MDVALNDPRSQSLADVRIIDLATEADAYCGKLLADLAADVVKVEPRNGEPGRRIAPFAGDDPSWSLFFQHYNTNKRSIALDPARPDDRDILQRLIAGADALILTGAPHELSDRGLDPRALVEKHPRLVVAVISPFGLSGPRCNWKSCDLVAQATGGMAYVNGHPGEPPLRAWGPQSHHAASLHAAIGILLALRACERTGRGQLVDVSLQESVASMLEHVGATFHATGEIQKRRGTLHWTRTFRVGRCRDGYVLLSILGDWTSLIEWMKADGAGDDFVDPAWEDIEYRRAHCEPLFAALDRWARGYSVEDLVEGAQARRLPFAPLLSVDDLPRQEQLVAREFFVSLHGRSYPGAPYRLSASPWRLRSPTPRCDEHREEILRELEIGNFSTGGRKGGNLPPSPSFVRRGSTDIPPSYEEGVDFLANGPSRRRQNTAAPQGERKKSSEVNNDTVRAEEALLRSEASRRIPRGRLEACPEQCRRALSAHLSTVSEGEGEGEIPPPYEGGSQGEVDSVHARSSSIPAEQTTPRPLHGVRILDFTWVVAGPLATRVLADHGAEVIKIERPDAKGLDRRREVLAASLNRGKRSVILDMETPRGVEIARALVPHCDVVIDNFSRRVMRNWGLSGEELRRIKPDVITLGMSGFGRDGPYRDYVSYGPTLQAMGGFTWHMRGASGEPAGWGFSYSDMVGGYSAAFAILAALRHRSRTGEGQSIDLAQYEALLTFIGPELFAAAGGRSVPVPSVPRGAPEGIYRCLDLERDGRKRDRWCALAVFSDQEWERCVQVLGGPKWALEPRFATLARRVTHREDLDANIEAWTSQRSAESVVDSLQAAQIAAGIVADAEDLCVQDPHLAARRYWQQTPAAGGRTLVLDAITPRLSETPGQVISVAPQPGDHTGQVLREILHMEETMIHALRRERIIV